MRAASFVAAITFALVPPAAPCAAAASAGAPAVAPARRPNILLILTDDQGYGDLSIHGNPHVRTPAIDRLGRDGVRFDRFYVNTFCAPTRAALLTGRWPLRTGCHGVTHNKEAMRPSEVTLAEALKRGGYRTGCFGKWHNGEQYPFTPIGQGFDEFVGFNNGHWNDYFDATLLRGAAPESTRGYITDVLTDEALAFIDANRARPFFCYLAYNAPHSPYQVPDRYYDRFAGRGLDPKAAAFYGMCENIDENVGRLLARLGELRLAEDTIVLFLTDNGGTAGVKIYNAGMRGGKTSVHEGGSRVPLFVRWPPAGWKPRVVRTLVSHIDVYPTLLDLCGVSAPAGPAIDGRSLRPLLEHGDDAPWPERRLFVHNPINETNRYPGAVRTPRHRLVREIRGRAGGSGAKANDAGATSWQLYDMEVDPGQTRDIAALHPALVRELSARYEAWFDDVSRVLPCRLPIPVGHAQHDPVELHAPQAYFDPPLRFASGPGFANDWLVDWTDAKARIWFELDVVRAGAYAVLLHANVAEADAGATLRLSAAGVSCEAVVRAFPGEELPLAHRDAAGRERYRNRTWSAQPIGTLTLPAGPTRLTLEAVAMPGSCVLSGFKALTLNRKP